MTKIQPQVGPVGEALFLESPNGAIEIVETPFNPQMAQSGLRSRFKS